MPEHRPTVSDSDIKLQECDLLPAWGSREQTSVHGLSEHGQKGSDAHSAVTIAAQQLGDYLASRGSMIGSHILASSSNRQLASSPGQHHASTAAAQGKQQQHQQQGSMEHQPSWQGFVPHMQEQQQRQQPQAQERHRVQAGQHDQQHLYSQYQQPQQQQACRAGSSPGGVPSLDLSRVKVGSSARVKVLPDSEAAVTAQTADKDAELCFERGSMRQMQLHPNAPLQDNRCYVYKAAGRQDIALLQDLLERLPTKESCEVAALWDALQVARHDCEVMAARGVRVTRDISRDWQETVSDLIDRVVAQDTELGQLRQQGKAAQASLGMEDQVVRLRRQRDSLLGDKQELSRILAASQEATRQAHREAAAAKDSLKSVCQKAKSLQEQHAALLRQHIELAAYAQQLEALAIDSISYPGSPVAVSGTGVGAKYAAGIDQSGQDHAGYLPATYLAVNKASKGRRPSLTVYVNATADGAAAAAGGFAMPFATDGAANGGSPDGRRGANSIKASPRGWLSPRSGLVPIHIAASSPRTGGAAGQPRTSNDTPDTMRERLSGSHAVVDQYDQQPAMLHIPVGMLGPAGKANARLLQKSGGSFIGGAGGWRPDLRGTIEAAQQQLDMMPTLPL